ncbi:MAG: Rieske 2Fe-2S domain-containing protein [Actinobacteria bacterium]|nr:Rieske 2Fe-2S domain-containing protein [Actinomycetota bacterium]
MGDFSVQPRTANTGATIWTVACDVDDLAPDRPLGIRLAETAICLVRTAGEVFAVHDECTHGAVPLSDGEVDGCTIECWLHGSRFDLRSGEALGPPATEPVRTFPVRVISGVVSVDIG